MDRRAFLALSSSLAAPRLADTGRVPVVASFSILADMVRNVGGPRVAVSTLVGPAADPHVFEPGARTAAAVSAARTVIVNGLGFEGWLARLWPAAGRRDAPVIATEGLVPLRAGGAPDPHAWHDLRNGLVYVQNIVRGLSAVDPAGALAYAARAEIYAMRIRALDARLRQAFRALPADRRVVLTVHDAFEYFGRAYGLRFLAVAGLSTREETSAGQVAQLVRQIRTRRVAGLFFEDTANGRLLSQIAQETGAAVGGKLYADALSPSGGPAADYLSLVHHNATTLLRTLSPRGPASP